MILQMKGRKRKKDPATTMTTQVSNLPRMKPELPRKASCLFDLLRRAKARLYRQSRNRRRVRILASVRKSFSKCFILKRVLDFYRGLKSRGGIRERNGDVISSTDDGLVAVWIIYIRDEEEVCNVEFVLSDILASRCDCRRMQLNTLFRYRSGALQLSVLEHGVSSTCIMS